MPSQHHRSMTFRDRREFNSERGVDANDLDRNIAIQARVTGTVHLSHSADTESGPDFVRAQPGVAERDIGSTSMPLERLF
jgi:hypothetical protein